VRPDAVIRTAKAAIDVLRDASRTADNRWQWWQINRLASELVQELHQIEQNEQLVPAIRRDARQDRESLRDIMDASCRKVEEFDKQPPIVNLS
jgi:chemotaxis regulatin CheY-phosphate phosphatase CheZ